MKAPKIHVESLRGMNLIDSTNKRLSQPWITVTRLPSVLKLAATTAVGVVNINR